MRGVLVVTAEIFVRAFGNFMPSMFVFPRARENKELFDDAPSGRAADCPSVGLLRTEMYLSGSTVLLNFESQQEGNLSFCFWMNTKVRQEAWN
jgi:hypothetical protein